MSVRMALAAIAEDQHLAALDQIDVGIAIVIDTHGKPFSRKISEFGGAARDRDDPGARDIDEPQRLHELDEGIELLGRSRHLEDEALDRAIDDPRAKDIGQAQTLDAPIARARHLDKDELALDRRPLLGK